MKHQPNWKRSGPRGGFTLIEVMIAISILSFGLLGLAAMQLYAMQGRSSGRHSTFAATLAQTHMDELQRRNWNTVADTGGAWLSQVQNNLAALNTLPAPHHQQRRRKSRSLCGRSWLLSRTKQKQPSCLPLIAISMCAATCWSVSSGTAQVDFEASHAPLTHP